MKILINSSTPIVIMETVEEMRALALVRAACSELNMAVFEWTIADGLVRSGSGASVAQTGAQSHAQSVGQSYAQTRPNSLPQGNSEGERLMRSVMSSVVSDDGAGAGPKTAMYNTSMYNTSDPVQALANLESMTIEAVFVLKDFHRHMDNPVVIRRLRDVGQKFSANRRTLVLTAPAIEMPPELASLGEFVDVPLPDRRR